MCTKGKGRDQLCLVVEQVPENWFLIFHGEMDIKMVNIEVQIYEFSLVLGIRVGGTIPRHLTFSQRHFHKNVLHTYVTITIT